MKIDPREIWRRTRLGVWPERYVLASVAPARLGEAASLVATTDGADTFAALVVERDEVSITIAEGAWAASGLSRGARTEGPFRALTLDVDVDLGVCGYLAPAAVRLAEAGVAIVPQCGFLKDHLLVHERDLDRAVEVLEAWIAECRR